MTRIFGHLCVRNEADRYLEEVLQWHSQFLDAIHVYDDQSDDDTVAIASHYAGVDIRHPSVPSFLEDESAFRQAGWNAMVRRLAPTAERDWILCLDADEFFVARDRDERAALEHAIYLTDLLRDVHATDLRIEEIFDVRDGVPMRRTDGFWGDIHGVRLVRYLPLGEFTPKRMGGGSIPNYARYSFDARVKDFALLHFGYADRSDREAKYARYSNVSGNGHNPKHIESILAVPTLEPVELERSLP